MCQLKRAYLCRHELSHSPIKNSPKGLKSQDLGNQLTDPERKIKCSPNSPVTKSIVVLRGIWYRLVETTCHTSQALVLWTKNVGYHLTVVLTIHGYMTIRSKFVEVRCNDANSP